MSWLFKEQKREQIYCSKNRNERDWDGFEDNYVTVRYAKDMLPKSNEDNYSLSPDISFQSKLKINKCAINFATPKSHSELEGICFQFFFFVASGWFTSMNWITIPQLLDKIKKYLIFLVTVGDQHRTSWGKALTHYLLDRLMVCYRQTK